MTGPSQPPAAFIVIGSVAWDEIIELDAPLRVGSHNGARAAGGRIGGGAANTAMALARAGDRVRLVSAVGEDGAGRALLGQLAEFHMDLTRVDRGAAETTRSLVMLDTGGERTVVNLARARVPLPADLSEMPADWLYARSADPALTPILAQRIARGGRVLAHVPPREAGCRPAQVLVGSASDLDADFIDDPFAAGRRIAGGALEWMVLTFGAQGAKAFGRGRAIEQRAQQVQAVDSTGAGDVFAAGLLHALARGRGMADALALAVHWGTLSVTYAGTLPPRAFPASA